MRKTKKESWLDERRDLFVKNVLRDFFYSHTFFLDIQRKYRDTGITFEGLDYWVGTQTDPGILWALKDNCHRLWRDIDPDKKPEPFLFDWMVGTIFHEAMKLKENVYMIVRYEPACRIISSECNAGNRQKRYQQFFEQILEDVHQGMERLESLLTHAGEQLKALLIAEKDNTLLVRFILENQSEMEKLWRNSGGIDRMLTDLFPEGLDKAYCMAGTNYLEGGWYAEARNAFEEAIRINPDCREAIRGLEVLEKRLMELALMLDREYTMAGVNKVPDIYASR